MKQTKLKTYFNWSSGKDSAMALHAMLTSDTYSCEQLLTSVNAHFNRVSMHGTHRSLLELQAKSIGLPLTTIELPEEPTMEEYEVKMKEVNNQLIQKGYTTTGFGDIFLEDLRNYRESKLNEIGISAHFPLWGKDTKELVRNFVKLGFKAIVVCTKAEFLDESFVGRELDDSFIADLPENVDPCGENGEYHTFCYDGPIFRHPIPFKIGEKVYKEYTAPADEQNTQNLGFWFCDLIPG